MSDQTSTLIITAQDCTDGTDEKNCTAVSCPDNKFHCPQVRHGARLRQKQRKLGVNKKLGICFIGIRFLSLSFSADEN